MEISLRGSRRIKEAERLEGGFFFRNTNDPNETIFLLEWDNLENAHGFANSEGARAILAQAGLSDKPDVYFLDLVFKPRR